MIRLNLADRADADLLVTGLYIAAGVLAPPTVPDKRALPLANELARQMEMLPDPPEATRGDA